MERKPQIDFRTKNSSNSDEKPKKKIRRNPTNFLVFRRNFWFSDEIRRNPTQRFDRFVRCFFGTDIFINFGYVFWFSDRCGKPKNIYVYEILIIFGFSNIYLKNQKNIQSIYISIYEFGYVFLVSPFYGKPKNIPQI